MKKAAIVGASECHVELDPNLDYIGVDGGNEILFKQHIKPMLSVGDFDSLTNAQILKEIKKISLPTHKDDTDSAIAIEYLIEKGYNDITLYGVTGGRLDHFLAVCTLLSKYRDAKLTIIDEQNKMYLLKEGVHKIQKEDYQYISFFALTKANLTIEGCAYPLDHYDLMYNDPLCVSNEILLKECTITTSNDIYVIQSRNKKGNESWQQK